MFQTFEGHGWIWVISNILAGISFIDYAYRCIFFIIANSIIQWDTEITRKNGIKIKVIHKSRHSYERTIQLIKKEKFIVKPYITHRFPLEKADEAFKTVENYEDNVLKAVIKP